MTHFIVSIKFFKRNLRNKFKESQFKNSKQMKRKTFCACVVVDMALTQVDLTGPDQNLCWGLCCVFG